MAIGKLKKIAFDLQNRVKGKEVTPSTISLPALNDFNSEVERFLQGNSPRAILSDTQIEIASGSYRLLVTLALAAASSVEADLAKLDHQDVLGEIDSRRAEIIEKWQARARRDPDFSVKIHSPERIIDPIVIGKTTDFRRQEADEWVATERYVVGKVVDVGGITNPNLHLVLEGSGQMLIASASEELLQEPKRNYMFHTIQVRICAKENIKTGAMKDIELLDFIGEAPSYDEAELEAFVEKGTKAWSNVPDSVAWVNKLREGH